MMQPPFDDLMDGVTLQFLVLRREAAYLYDAVKVYAWSLRESLRFGEDPYNGTRIIERLRLKPYLRSVCLQYL